MKVARDYILKLTEYGLEGKIGLELRRGRLLNLALLLGVAIGFSLSSYFLLLNQQGFTPVYAVNGLSILGYLTVFFVHRRLRTSLAMWLGAVVAVSQIVLISVLLGTSALNQVFLLGLPILAILIASEADQWSIWGMTVIAVAVFLILNNLDLPGLADDLASGLQSQIKTSNIVATFAVFFGVSLYYRYSAQRAEAELKIARDRSDVLLNAIFPTEVAETLKVSQDAEIAEQHANVTVLFADIVGFTNRSRELSAEDLVKNLNTVFSNCDLLAKQHGIEKIKTIGDAYFAVGGLSENDTDHVRRIAQFAQALEQLSRDLAQGIWPGLRFRIAIHTGPAIAGVIGKSKFSYDVWGDTVNFTARLVRECKPGEILISEASYSSLYHTLAFSQARQVELRDVGRITAYQLKSPQ